VPDIRPESAFQGESDANSGDFGRYILAFTIAPHLQTINYRGRFSRFVGI
jgi:hypothetical protein